NPTEHADVQELQKGEAQVGADERRDIALGRAVETAHIRVDMAKHDPATDSHGNSEKPTVHQAKASSQATPDAPDIHVGGKIGQRNRRFIAFELGLTPVARGETEAIDAQGADTTSEAPLQNEPERRSGSAARGPVE